MKGWTRSGNTNRIFEMNKAGFGVHAIAGVFRDNGIKISVGYVREVINNDKAMTSKALPKKEVKKIIKNVESHKEASATGNMLPA